jgi:glucose-1-phosphate adenylyltransferase
MDYSEMIRLHIERGSDLTIGCIPVPVHDANQFGILDVDANDRITTFVEKPEHPPEIVGNPGFSLASMGIYVFTAASLFELLFEDAVRKNSSHDFGKNIIPNIISKLNVHAFLFQDKNKKSVPYWRDVGTLDAYYQANMDLVGIDPVLNLYDTEWPIRTFQPQFPPPKFVFNDEGTRGQSRRGEAHDSIVCQGSIISGGSVSRSILSSGVRVNSYATVDDCILFEGVNVGRHSRIRRAIIDKNVQLPPDTVIGYDIEEDRKRGFTVSENGIVVISKAESPESFSARQTRK